MDAARLPFCRQNKEREDNRMEKMKMAVIAALSALMAWMGVLAVPVLLLVGCNLIDYVTGRLAAKYRTQEITSYKGLKGIIKKVCMWLLIVVGAVVDVLINYALENFAGTGEYVPVSADKSIPAAGIARGTIRAVLYAQGMAGAASWDGTITVSEAIAEMGLPMLPPAGTAAVPSVAHVPLKRQGISAPVPEMGLKGLSLPGISAGVSCTTETG